MNVTLHAFPTFPRKQTTGRSSQEAAQQDGVEAATGNTRYSQGVDQRSEMKSSLPLPPTSQELGRSWLRGALSRSVRRQEHALDVIKQGERALLIYFSPKGVDVAIVQRRGTFCSCSVIILALW